MLRSTTGKMMRDAYLRAYATADAEQLAEGLLWYRVARGRCRSLSRHYKVTLATACGIVAALSANNLWSTNLAMAEDALRLRRSPICYASQRRKVNALLRGGAPLRVLRGPKERAFFAALRGSDDAVVIDRWMYRIVGIDAEIGEKWPTLQRYKACAAAIREAAAAVGRAPALFQAVAWVTVRDS